jgi:hypothetical protein
MGTVSGSEAVRAVQEVLLVDRLQHLAHGVLDQLVLDAEIPIGRVFLCSFGMYTRWIG